jgi:hypothetical protein
MRNYGEALTGPHYVEKRDLILSKEYTVELCGKKLLRVMKQWIVQDTA